MHGALKELDLIQELKNLYLDFKSKSKLQNLRYLLSSSIAGQLHINLYFIFLSTVIRFQNENVICPLDNLSLYIHDRIGRVRKL